MYYFKENIKRKVSKRKITAKYSSPCEFNSRASPFNSELSVTLFLYHITLCQHEQWLGHVLEALLPWVSFQITDPLHPVLKVFLS